MSDGQAVSVNPWRRRGLRLLIAIAVFAFAAFVPLFPCSTSTRRSGGREPGVRRRHR